MAGFVLLTLLVFVVKAVVGSNMMSVKEGDLVTLKSDVVKQGRDQMLWYFNNTLIAQINGEESKSCVYYGEDEIFRDRLEVDYETGSLTITDIGPEHTGLYEANFIKSKSSGTSHSLNRNSKCDSRKIIKKTNNIGDTVTSFIVFVTDSGLSAAVIAGMGVGVGVGVGVLLLAAAVLGPIYYCRSDSKRENMEKNKFQKLLNVPA